MTPRSAASRQSAMGPFGWVTMPRCWTVRRKLSRLPAITVSTTADYYKPFTSPNPNLKAKSMLHNVG
jgi:hypothetical protein